MKAVIAVFLGIFSFFSSYSQLKAFFTYSTFFSPENGPYIETYLSVIGNSVKYQKNSSGKFQGSIDITMVFKQGENISNFKKYNLLSPELDDTLNSFVNFIDQQRFLLPNGNYNLELTISDKNSSGQPFNSVQPVNIDYSREKIFISDVEVIESYKQSAQQTILSKSGYDLVPYVSNFFPAGMGKISFYGEIYNTEQIFGKEEKYLVNYFIEKHETGKPLNNFRSFLRQTSNPVNVVLTSINIDNLPSGNYNLVIEVRNKNNELKADRKMFFQRSNPDFQMKTEDISSVNITGTFVDNITNKDTLAEYIRSVRPVSSEIEMRFADNNFPEKSDPDLALMQKFFLNFWNERNNLNPEQEWENYKKQVVQANKSFSTKIKKGYETDRGRIYLKYGAPNSLIDRSQEPSNYPYQIWHYYKTEKRGNSKFVFYNPDEVTNDYELLHSNVLGEINDFRWQYRLQRRNTPNTNLDEPKGQEHYGNRPEDFWNNPR